MCICAHCSYLFLLKAVSFSFLKVDVMYFFFTIKHNTYVILIVKTKMLKR